MQTQQKDRLRSGKCKDYAPEDNMFRCEERRTKEILLSFLGCLPPLLNSWEEEYENLTCKSDLKLRGSRFNQYIDHYFRITASQLCPPPCSSIHYTAKIKNVERIYYTGVVLNFLDEVVEVEQRLQHNALSLLTTLGGHIGVCRTLLWALIGCIEIHALLTKIFT